MENKQDVKTNIFFPKKYVKIGSSKKYQKCFVKTALHNILQDNKNQLP